VKANHISQYLVLTVEYVSHHNCAHFSIGLIAEDEHDVVWFWLQKDKPHECPVCSQYFVVTEIKTLTDCYKRCAGSC
jgi:hypothetical protein